MLCSYTVQREPNLACTWQHWAVVYCWQLQVGQPQCKWNALLHFLDNSFQEGASQYYATCTLPNKKVKVTFTLEQATKAQRGSRDIKLYSFLNFGDRCGWW